MVLPIPEDPTAAGDVLAAGSDALVDPGAGVGAGPGALVDSDVGTDPGSGVDALAGPGWVSTGDLPPAQEVQAALDDAHARYRRVPDGTVADYIPALASASPDHFGLAVVGVSGRSWTAGDARVAFSIQSVAKPFVFALVCDALGHRRMQELVGVNSTGLPFNSVVAVEQNRDRTANPMVNAGAIAVTSLVAGQGVAEKWARVRAGLSAFAGRDLALDEAVHASEAATNDRNRGIAHLLQGYGRMYCDPDDAVEVYTRQCSLLVTAMDLAVMGATLADGGVNPITRERVVSADTCWRVLAALATAGLYELSGDWLYEVGLPGKSGVSGALVTISPGKGALGTYSPPLDEAGNSVRGQFAARRLSTRLGLNLFTSTVAEPAES